jgi:cell division protein FtsL
MIKKIFLIFLVFLFLANIFIFMVNIQLGEEIKMYDKKIHLLRQENLDLETKIYQLTSYEKLASLAAQLNFVKNESPVYLEEIKYAYKN